MHSIVLFPCQCGEIVGYSIYHDGQGRIFLAKSKNIDYCMHCEPSSVNKLFEEGREIDIKRTFEERDRLGTTNVTELFLKPKSVL